MKKHFLVLLLLLVSGLSGTGLSAANGEIICKVPAESTCEAPAPYDFKVTTVTTSSISLAWNYSFAGVYFFLSGYDNTASAPLPSVTTTSLSYTYTGIPAGHDCTFSVAASYCADGPGGLPAYTSGSTIIIIDDIVNLEICPPNITITNPSTSAQYPFCVRHSTTEPPSTLDNVYTGQLSYDGNSLRFGMAFIASENAVYLNATTNLSQRFYFQDTDGSYAVCKYVSNTNTGPSSNDPSIFTVGCTGYDTDFDDINMRIRFNVSLGSYTYCGNVCPETFAPPIGGGDAEKALSLEFDRSSNVVPVVLGSPRPNPFQDAVELQYELPAESTVSIQMFDVMGRLLQTVLPSEGPQAAGIYTVRIGGTELPDGQYFLRLQTDSESRVFSVIKQN